MKKRSLFVCALLLVSFAWVGTNRVRAEGELPSAASQLFRLRTLENTVRILYVTAHPDDEDAALLTWMSRYLGFRVLVYTLTRGEGGENVIGNETGDALGIVRTEEQLAAAREYGVDQLFGRVSDFGYSKTLEETFKKWNRDAVLIDLVRVIRGYKPDVLISRFQGNKEDGHGQHQAAGAVSRDAFVAAADGLRFPELKSEGLAPWAVTKFYAQVRTKDRATLPLYTGVFDPLLGQSYAQLGKEGYGLHRSQASVHILARRKMGWSYLVRINATDAEKKKERSIQDGLTLTLADRAHLFSASAEIQRAFVDYGRAIANAKKAFSPLRPYAAYPWLAYAAAILDRVIDKSGSVSSDLLRYVSEARTTLNDALAQALGLELSASLTPPKGDAPNNEADYVVSDVWRDIDARVSVRNTRNASIEKLSLSVPSSWEIKHAGLSKPEPLMPGQPFETGFAFLPKIAKNKASNDWRTAFLPFADPRVRLEARVRVAKVVLVATAPILASKPHPYLPARKCAIEVRPRVTLRAEPARRILVVSEAKTHKKTRRQKSNEINPTTVFVRARNHTTEQISGVVRLDLPEGWKSMPESVPLTIDAMHVGEARFEVIRRSLKPREPYRIYPHFDTVDATFDQALEVLEHPDLQPRSYMTRAEIKVTAADVTVPKNLRIGYVEGTADGVADVLGDLGIAVTLLNERDLREGSFGSYKAIVVGPRAFSVRSDLVNHYGRLLEYAKAGGTLIVQFQTEESYRHTFGPYPYVFADSPEEVSEEDAPVTVLDPKHRVFKTPNAITPADFDGWVSERGSKFWKSWDPSYTPLLESHDNNQEEQKGGLLIAHTGRGYFVYAAYAFYRQLPELIVGPIRLFVNLLSL